MRREAALGGRGVSLCLWGSYVGRDEMVCGGWGGGEGIDGGVSE